MNKHKLLILAAVVAIAGLAAFGIGTRPAVQPIDADGFSAVRAAKDIEVISKRPHSAAHPLERAEVRDYLVSRLEQSGADTVRLYKYDSLTGPQNKHVSYTFDAVNVLAEFSPEKEIADPTYLMLIAHYDSRFSQPMPKDTVWSYGAADDGYGLSVILETVSQAVKFRKDWNQGIKVLFTDGEEVGMMGMKSIWENDREVFDNVGFVINVEARGPWGPAILFETSPGNAPIMELYDQTAAHPFTYSLTTVVYSMMPNFTDFNVVKDEIPGVNFSTVADINHYHTDLDNFSNINEKTIQHYGSQMLPMVEEYLIGEKYSDRGYLKSEENDVYFTIPLLGLFSFTEAMYKAINIIIFIIFFLVFALEGVRGRLKASKIFKSSLLIIAVAIGVMILGEAVAYVASLAAGAKFRLFGTVQGIGSDNLIMLVSTIVMICICIMVYLRGRGAAVRKASGSMRASAASSAAMKYSGNLLYASMTVMFVFSAALLFTIGENMMFFIPFALATAALMLYRFTSLRFWLLCAVGLILLHAFSFLFILSMALTIGAFGAVIMLAFLDLMLLIPMSDIYLTTSKK